MHFPSAWDFMMGLASALPNVKSLASSITEIYENLFLKNYDKPKWGNLLLCGETDFTVGFADPMFPIRCATVVELRL